MWGLDYLISDGFEDWVEGLRDDAVSSAARSGFSQSGGYPMSQHWNSGVSFMPPIVAGDASAKITRGSGCPGPSLSPSVTLFIPGVSL